MGRRFQKRAVFRVGAPVLRRDVEVQATGAEEDLDAGILLLEPFWPG